MYSGSPKASLDIVNGTGGSSYVTVTSLSDYFQDKKSTTMLTGKNTVYSGDIADLAFKPDEGKTIDSIQLQSKDGTVLEEFLVDKVLEYDPKKHFPDDSQSSKETFTISAQEQLENYSSDDDGYCHVTFPVPYQDCKLVISYKDYDTSLMTYSSTLHDTAEGDVTNIVMMYGGYEYLPEKESSAGSTVDVIATGYNGAIAGSIYVTLTFSDECSDDSYYIQFGSIVGESSFNTLVSHVNSYVNIESNMGDTMNTVFAAGIVNSVSDSTTESCVNFGRISGDIVGSSGIAYSAFQSDINNCANIGSIRISATDPGKDIPNIGGICKQPLASGSSQSNVTIRNCYNYGVLSCKDPNKINTIADKVSDKIIIENCYYLEGSSSDSSNATVMSAAQFSSGMAGFMLNNKINDGTQAWYQNIDNGKTPDPYPLPDNTRGTIYLLTDTYSNYPENVVKKVLLTIDTDKFIYNEAGEAVYPRIYKKRT